MGKYLSSHGHRSLVVSVGGCLVPQLVAEGSEHIHMRIGDKSPLTLRFILKLCRLIRTAGGHFAFAFAHAGLDWLFGLEIVAA